MIIDYIVITKYSDNSRKAFMAIRSSTDKYTNIKLYIAIKEAKQLIKVFKLQEIINNDRGIETRIYEPLKQF